MPPTLGITIGDPLGIGPEVTLKALAEPAVARAAHWRIYGPRSLLGAAASGWPDAREAPRAPVAIVEPDAKRAAAAAREAETSGRSPMPHAGALSFALVDRAISDALRPAGDPARVDGIVTAPISKEAWKLAEIGRAHV